MDFHQTWYVHWYCGDLVLDCKWANFVNCWQSYLPETHPYFCFRTITWVNNKGFSPNLLYALTLRRLIWDNLLMGKSRQISLWKHAYSNILKILPPKNENFRIKIRIFSYFYSKHRLWVLAVRTASLRLQWGGSNKYPQSMFLSRNKKINVYPCKP